MLELVCLCSLLLNVYSSTRFKTIGRVWFGADVLLFIALICVEIDVCVGTQCVGANYGNYLSVNHVWMLWLITIVLSLHSIQR